MKKNIETGGQSFVEDAEKKKVIEQLHARLNEALNGNNYQAVLMRVSSFTEKLRTKYGDDVNMCRLYHVLASNGIQEECTHFDFSENDSIQEFIEHLR